MFKSTKEELQEEIIFLRGTHAQLSTIIGTNSDAIQATCDEIGHRIEELEAKIREIDTPRPSSIPPRGLGHGSDF